MAASKKNKKVKQREIPDGRHVARVEDPNKYLSAHPSWNFQRYDSEKWSFTHENAKELFWKEILPFLKNLESQTWNEILIGAKKQHHSIDLSDLNKLAQDRLVEMRIEAESITSLRLNSTHRLYGYIIESNFYIIWFDTNHGDNDYCVCRAHKKHT